MFDNKCRFRCQKSFKVKIPQNTGLSVPQCDFTASFMQIHCCTVITTNNLEQLYFISCRHGAQLMYSPLCKKASCLYYLFQIIFANVSSKTLLVGLFIMTSVYWFWLSPPSVQGLGACVMQVESFRGKAPY